MLAMAPNIRAACRRILLGARDVVAPSAGRGVSLMQTKRAVLALAVSTIAAA